MSGVDLALRPHRILAARPERARLFVYGLFLLSGVGQSVIVPILGRLSSVYGLSASGTALVLALPGLATLVVSIPAGVAADRWGARRVTLAAGMLMSVACAAQAVPSLAILMAGRLAFGVAYAAVWTSAMAWLAQLSPGPDRLGPAVTCASVGSMAGPAIGGMLAQSGALGLPFLLIGSLTALVMAPLTLDRGGRRPPASRPAAAPDGSASPPPARARRDEIAILLRSPRLAAATGALVVAGAVSGVSQLLVSLQMRADGVSTGDIGLAFSLAAVAYILVSAVIARMGERASTLRLNAGATALLSVALLPALAGGHPYALGGALLLAAMPRAAVNTIAYTLVAEPGAGDARRAMAFGILNGAWAGALVLAPLLAGSLEQRAGAGAGYLAAIVPSGAIAVWLVLRARREPSPALQACR